jgi:hypothetical protein
MWKTKHALHLLWFLLVWLHLIVKLFILLCNKIFPLPHFFKIFILNSHGVDRKDNENDTWVQTTLKEPMCFNYCSFWGPFAK